jgi:hypothetical protein
MFDIRVASHLPSALETVCHGLNQASVLLCSPYRLFQDRNDPPSRNPAADGGTSVLSSTGKRLATVDLQTGWRQGIVEVSRSGERANEETLDSLVSCSSCKFLVNVRCESMCRYEDAVSIPGQQQVGALARRL